MTNKNKIEAVIFRINNGSYSDEDLLQYNAWCNKQQHAEVQKDFTDKNEQMFRFIKKREERKRQRNAFVRMTTVAAALVLLFLAQQIWKIDSKIYSEDKTAATFAHQIPLGFNETVLTLSNGDTLHLTSAMKKHRFVQDNSITTVSPDHKLSIEDRKSDWNKSDITYNALATSKGQQYHLVLPDGTKVWLNAASSIRYPLSFRDQKERKVELVGEAYFEVAKNKQQAFVVASRNQQVKVLGTHFNINSYPDEPVIKTTLLEGSVEINQKIVLQPGEQSQIDNSNDISKTSVDPDVVMAWKRGYFEFRDENIYEIMRKVKRFHNIDAIYEGNIPLDGMSGQIRIKDNIEKILDILRSTSLLKITQKNNKVYIRKF